MSKISKIKLPVNTSPKTYPLKMNASVYSQQHGIEIGFLDYSAFNLHYQAWQMFLEDEKNEWCIIYDDCVKLSDEIDLEKIVEKLPRDTELFFPYDKLKDYQNISAPKISGTRLGLYWGSYIYFLSKPGAQKLVDSTIEISLPLDEYLLEASFSGYIHSYFKNTNCFQYRRRLDSILQARKKIISDKIFGTSIWPEGQKEQALSLLSSLLSHAEKLDVKLYLHAGTLLGAIRHERIMPWDDDIDISMREQDLAKFTAAIYEEGRIQITPWTFKKTGRTYYKFWLKGGEKVEGYEYEFPFIDIWLLTEIDDYVDMTDGYVFKKQYYFPGKAIQFEGSRIYLPERPLVILDAMYTDWSSSIKVFSWCHRLKQPLLTRHVVPIATNENGLML